MNKNQYELYHYGVKGMKWGVRRAQKKQARANYKSAKKAAANKRSLNYKNSTKNLDLLTGELDRGRISRLEFERANSKATKKVIAGEHQYRVDKAKAKRDYKEAIGKDVGKANAKYERAKNRSASRARSGWEYYVESIVRDHPDVANSLAKTRTIKYSDIAKANKAIQDGLEFQNQMKDARISELERENRRLREQSVN